MKKKMRLPVPAVLPFLFLFFLLLFFLLTLFGCSSSIKKPSSSVSPSAASEEEKEEESIELYAMDTVMNLTAYGPNASHALEAAREELVRLDQLWSVSSEHGEIGTINANHNGDLSEDSLTLLSRALECSEETDGLFDCTIKPVMDAWGFTTQNYRVPSANELQELCSYVNYHQITLKGNHVVLPEQVSLDLGGIAKGFSSDRVMELFRASGVTSGIISLGGNVQTLGHKPDGSLWRVGIQDPDDLNNMAAVIEVADQAVITSGTYQRFFEQDGVTYHHIIDPRTGCPADSDLTSVTIVSSDGTLADALSTSLFIMGSDQASAFWQTHKEQFDLLMMTKNGEIIISEGIAEHCTIVNDGKARVIS